MPISQSQLLVQKILVLGKAVIGYLAVFFLLLKWGGELKKLPYTFYYLITSITRLLLSSSSLSLSPSLPSTPSSPMSSSSSFSSPHLFNLIHLLHLPSRIKSFYQILLPPISEAKAPRLLVLRYVTF